MSTEPAPQTGQRALGWINAASMSMVVAAWLALVLHYQYHVVWLGDYVVVSDAVFLTGVAGTAVTWSVERRGIARLRPVALLLVFYLAVFAGALIVGEFAVRFVFRRALSSVGPHISLNSLGFREREIGPKNPNRYRIAVIGDSLTFGNGIEDRDRFSNLIEGFLGPRYEVLNFGAPAHNMPQHLETLDEVLTLSPDFVLLQLYENDFETSSMNRPQAYPLLPSDLDRRMVRSSLLYRLLIDRWTQFQAAVGLAESYTGYMARHLADPNSADAREAFGNLRQFIDRARTAGVPSGAVLFPALYGMGPNNPFGYLHDRVRTICADGQIPYLDLLPALSTFRDPRGLAVSPFDAHPNAKANHRAAFEILNEFGSVWHH